MSPEALADVLLASCRAAMPNGTVMEIDDVKVPAERILPAFAGAVREPEDEKERQFAPLVARLGDGKHGLNPLTPVLKDAPKKPKAGTPRALILCLSGIRCADVVRAVRDIERPGGEVAKVRREGVADPSSSRSTSNSTTRRSTSPRRAWPWLLELLPASPSCSQTAS